MTDKVINIQDVKAKLEQAKDDISNLSPDELTALTIEKISDNLGLALNTLETLTGIVEELGENYKGIVDWLIELEERID